MPLRTPAVAGSFYPDREEMLRRELDSMIAPGPKSRALGVVVPHAGYGYSGRVAGAVYGRVEIPRDVVLLCFNHRGRGADFGVWPEGAWRTPLGDAPVNAELAERVRASFADASFDEAGHAGEHSGEVQLPFLQRLQPDLRIVPVALSVGLEEAARLRGFGEALASLDEEFLVVASTDLNHYEDQETTLAKDAAAIRAIEALDASALRESIRREEISMCGFAPVMAAMAYARKKNAGRPATVMHATSGDVSGDRDRVVGYVGMIIPCGN